MRPSLKRPGSEYLHIAFWVRDVAQFHPSTAFDVLAVVKRN
jgi:hypothetical protein